MTCPEFADEAKRALIPHPNAVSTFEMSLPDFVETARTDLYRRLLRLRRERIMPALKGAVSEGATAVGPAAAVARWQLGDGSRFILANYLGENPATASLPNDEPFLGDAADSTIPPCSTTARIAYG